MITKEAFTGKVLQVMNELGWGDVPLTVFQGANNTKVEEHIEQVYPDAWKQAVKILPKTYFEAKDFSGSSLTADTAAGTGYVVLPADFYALFSFRMQGWKTDVTELYTDADPVYALQQNEYTRGGTIRPVCIATKKAVLKDGNTSVCQVLEYYSLPPAQTHRIEQALYIPLVTKMDDKLLIDDRLIVPLSYLCGGLVYNIFGKYDIAQVLTSKATETI